MYNHKLIEKKWMQKWQQEKVYAFKDDYNKPKFYVLDMFPYPSGSGLHVGHVKGYTATDILSRYKRLNGFNVLHPIGWDAFGLPAEQYALDTKNHPKQFTLENIDRFRSQLLLLGFDYDYAKEVNTTDENFYKWTQWIFIQLYKNNLAEIKEIDVNWCEALGTVLANEEVLKAKDGSLVSERGNHPVIKKPMKQWVLKITAYADQLLQGLDEVDWPQSLKDIQRKWIGKTNGYEIEFKGANFDGAIKIFTTKPYTIFGTTNLVIAPESNYINLYIQNKSLALINYINLSKNKNSFERQKKASLKTGIKTDLTVFHPFTNELIDVYVSDYVLANYGTGAIMAVPSLDERDFAFAQAFNLKTKIILQDNKLINSDFLNGLSIEQANLKIIDHLKIKKIGQAKTTYKIKDWIFSRQRYWGEPFPVLYDEDGNIIIDENLPCVLPYTKHIEVAKDGTSPLSNLKHWVYVEIDHKLYRRDTNTMPQWAGSSWYYIAYILKNNDGSYLDLNSKAAYEKMQRWLPVDIYIGGQEHAVLHLLYSRFWHRFLYDIKVVPTKEPFQFIYNQGMVLDKNNQKMSKSKNNVVNPLDVIEQYGADTLRLYEMFMGPLNASLPWNSAAVGAMHKWLNKIYRLFMTKTIINQENNNGELEVKYHQFIKNVTNNIEKLNFNTAISEMMIFINECYKAEVINQQYLKAFVIVLSCFAPYISEELYQKYFCNNLDKNFLSVNFEKWPTYNEALIIKQMINLPIQINGKFKKVITIAKDSEQDLVIQLIKQDHQLSKIIDVDKAKKIIFLKNKIINLIF